MRTLEAIDEGVNILVTGDFYGGNRIEELILKNKYAEIFNDLLPEIKKADIAITNLESALTYSDKTIAKTGPAIKSHPKTIEALQYAGFSLVTLANNHIMDYGESGLNDTIEILKKESISYVGAGDNIQAAEKPFIFLKKGLSVAILNFAENEWSTTHGKRAGANPVDPVKNFNSIQIAKSSSDKVIVITHGGHEMYTLPSPRMKDLFRFYVDAGADAVINHHTHCESGYEIYKNAPIFYSIGNFIFDNADTKHSEWNEGMAISLMVTKTGVKFSTVHFNQNDKSLGVRLCSEAESEKRKTKLNDMNKIILNDVELEKAFHEWINRQRRLYKSFIEPHKSRVLLALQNRKFLPSLWSKRKKLFLLNLIRCEAHREVLIGILEDEISNS